MLDICHASDIVFFFLKGLQNSDPAGNKVHRYERTEDGQRQKITFICIFGMGGIHVWELKPTLWIKGELSKFN